MKCVYDLIKYGQEFKADNNTWVVGDIGTSGFYMSIDNDSIWENSIDICVDTMSYSKESGGIEKRRYNLPMTPNEIKMCEDILTLFKE